MPWTNFTGNNWWKVDVTGSLPITLSSTDMILPESFGPQFYGLIPKDVYVDILGALIVPPGGHSGGGSGFGIPEGYTGGDPNAQLWYQYYQVEQVRLVLAQSGADNAGYDTSNFNLYSGPVANLGLPSPSTLNTQITYDKTSNTYTETLVPIPTSEIVTALAFTLGLGQQMTITQLSFFTVAIADQEFWGQYEATAEFIT